MEDDEEYSYSGYSDSTAMGLTSGGYVDYDDEFSYSDYSADTAAEVKPAETGFYGDFLVEEFSPESAVGKVAKVTHLSEDAIAYILGVLYFVFGVVFVAFTIIFALIYTQYEHYVTKCFVYMVGGIMIFAGLLRFVSAVRRKEYKDTHTNATASSLIFIALGIMIVVETEVSVYIIAIAWGILGLLEGAHAFNHAFSRISRGQNPTYYLIKGAIEVVLAFMLMLEGEITTHIIVLGVQLIFDAITMLPVVKRYVHNKK